MILYAGENDTNFIGLKKPTDEAVKQGNFNAYIKVSIFVPERLLPTPDKFQEVFIGPNEVYHGDFCLREKRSHYECKELSF